MLGIGSISNALAERGTALMAVPSCVRHLVAI